MIKQTYKYEGKFQCEEGGVLDGIQITYHCSREKYSGEKVIWICHALTASSDVEDWWPELVGKGKLFDPDEFFIVCCNMLGSCYGTTGPSSIDPSTGKPYYLTFPRVTVRDIVRTQNIIREHLGIEKIDFLIGASIGGFQALEYSIMYPDVVLRAAYIATLDRVTPWLTAFEESQRMALEADRTFRECASLEGGKEGLKCARTIALISYRNDDGYNRKQFETDDDVMFPDRAASYQRYQGKKLANRFDAYSYWYLAYGVDSENVGRGRGGVAKALSTIKAKTMTVSIDSDLIFPARDMARMAEMIPGTEYHMITSHYGHDGFLLEYDQLTELFLPVLDEIRATQQNI
ncbi:MAG: homoserine O-acetyltransferase [Bacteroidales bacterium]|nr:homoserine O-acetyltransferase [Bacteroidales bacterium]MBQ9711715.1 homoserine O-acetyltransferase [Bacteroidales bacterium]